VEGVARLSGSNDDITRSAPSLNLRNLGVGAEGIDWRNPERSSRPVRQLGQTVGVDGRIPLQW